MKASLTIPSWNQLLQSLRELRTVGASLRRRLHDESGVGHLYLQDPLSARRQRLHLRRAVHPSRSLRARTTLAARASAPTARGAGRCSLGSAAPSASRRDGSNPADHLANGPTAYTCTSFADGCRKKLRPSPTCPSDL